MYSRLGKFPLLYNPMDVCFRLSMFVNFLTIAY